MKSFPILLELEDEAVGSVLRLVKNLKGVIRVHLDLDAVPDKVGRAGKAKSSEPKEPKEPKEPRAPRDPNRSSPRDIIIRYLIRKGTAHLDELRTELGKHGYSAGHTASTTITPMRKEGITEAGDGAGMQRLTEKFRQSLHQHTNGAIAPALPSSKNRALPAPKKWSRRKRSPDGLSTVQIMLGMCAEPTAAAAIAGELTAKGFSAHTLPNLVTKTRSKGWLSIVEPGVYKTTERGAAHLKAISAQPG